MKKLLLLVAFGGLLVGAACAPSDPLAGLSADDKQYLFADTDTNAPFLGQPIDGGPLNCYPQRMNQGYVLIDTQSSLWLDSIRPTGVERHKILSVEKSDTGFVINGENGVAAPFKLFIEKRSSTMASISWDGAPAELFRRCEVAGQ